MRIALAITLMTALAAAPACGKKAEAPPPAPAETAPPAETTPPAATAPPAETSAPATAGEEEAQPRRGLEEAPTGETPPPTPSTPEERLAAALNLEVGDAVDLGDGPWAAPALGYLPLTTVTAVVVASPQKVLDTIGFEAITAKLGEGYGLAAAQSKAATGIDLTSPAGWAEAGVDPSGPAGVAILAAEGKEVQVLFATIADKEKLNAALTVLAEKAKREIVREQVGDAEILRAKDDGHGAAILRDKTLLLIGQDRAVPPEAVMRGIATQDPATSFARAKDFTGAVKGVVAGKDGLVWVNAAFAAAASRDEVRGAAEKAMFDRVYSGLHGLAIGFSLEDTAVVGTGSLPLDAGSPLRSIVRNGSATPIVFGAETKAPLVGVTVNLDLDAVLALVDEGLKAQGQSLESMEAAVNEMAQLDVRKDVVGALTGEVGFVVDGDLAELMKSEADARQNLGGALVIGLKDAAGTQKRVEELLKAMPEIAKAIPPAQSPGTWTVPTPFGREVTVRFAGNYLVVASDPAFAARVEANDRSQSFVAGLGNEPLKTLLSREDLAGAFVMRPAIAAYFLFAMRGMDRPIDEAPREGEDKAIAAKRKELAAARKELDALREAQEDAGRKAMLSVFTQVGTTAEVVHVSGDGLSFVIGQYLEAPVKDVIAAAIDTRIAMETAEDKMHALSEKVFTLESEISSHEMKVEEAAPDAP